MANPVNVIEQYYAVVPTPETAVTDEMSSISVPLTFFDILWIILSPVERLVFYELPLSHSQFVERYIPKLKDSLSSTLKHFPPITITGNFIYPSDLTINPEIRYSKGDAVSIIFAESCQNNFKYLISNYPRNCHAFYPLIPQLISSANTGLPVLALQVTLFPGAGICVGITNHHVVGDASSIFRFMKTWALKSKYGGEKVADVSFPSPPSFDRSVIKDPKGLASLFLKQMKSLNRLNGKGTLPPSDEKYKKLRQTFVLVEKDIHKLKNIVRTKRPTIKHLSAFTITCAYVWTCLEKYYPPEESESFMLPVDCRGRVNPPIPENYFGNCLTFCLIHANPQELVGVGEDEFSNLVEKFGEILQDKLGNKDEVLADAETWITTVSKIDPKRTRSVAGSPKFNYYDLDFGWGKPIKFECTSIDQTGAISLSGCRDSGEEGGNGIEVGMSLVGEKLDAFASAFNEGLAALNSV